MKPQKKRDTGYSQEQRNLSAGSREVRNIGIAVPKAKRARQPSGRGRRQQEINPWGLVVLVLAVMIAVAIGMSGGFDGGSGGGGSRHSHSRR
jgi:hypothetical protein